MSYDIRLIDPITKETLELEEPHNLRGGTYAMGGTPEAWLNRREAIAFPPSPPCYFK
jgi:hypothetical protein